MDETVSVCPPGSGAVVVGAVVADGVETVGVTSGASVPEVLVQEVLDDLADAGYGSVQVVKTAEEDLMFSLPKELRGDDRALGGRRE